MTATVPETAHDLVRLLEQLPELDAYRIELIDGKIVMLPSAAPFHNFIQTAITSQFFQQGWWSMVEQALVSPERAFEPKPDVVVTSHDEAADNANPFPAHRVAITVEIVSTDRDSDYAKKRAWYALSGIPLYLIVDPNEGIWELHSDPRDGGYRVVAHGRFGEDVELPEPFSFAVGTETFKVYPPRR
ncbi:Uma2 family endonuclease [Kitasatospora sp. NBC_01287]|uniref:Uma2 family endonuclease n=1 Tax=Kitasatospora sp. NBC_01287 TaxID=2903573 RepID=UPI002250E53C|nr:Uma2 family endonuclease [Kitasatospora sp. NBC_01287]MCX4748562.1 Uma2 family endonuclease [Kitasatospora sp. NBC_01287]